MRVRTFRVTVVDGLLDQYYAKVRRRLVPVERPSVQTVDEALIFGVFTPRYGAIERDFDQLQTAGWKSNRRTGREKQY